MNKKKINFSVLSFLIVLVFAIASVVPTLTALFIGNKPIKSFAEALLAFSPDVFFLSALCLALFTFITKKELRFEWQWFDTVVSLYLLFNLTYGFTLSDKDMLALLSARISYLPITFYFLARLYNSQKEELSKKILNIVFYIYVILGVIGLALYFIFPETHEQLMSMSGHVMPRYFIVRMGSLYLTPVLFATAIAFSAVYFYQKYYTSPSFKRLIIYLLLWTCLLLSVSRGAIISYVIAFIVISLIYKNYRKFLKVLVSMIIIVLGVSYYATQGLGLIEWGVTTSAKTVTLNAGENQVKLQGKDNQKIFKHETANTSTLTENNGAATRVNLWQATIHDFKEQPWGYGLGKTGAVAHRHLMDNPEVKASLYSTDGWYLKMACENGVFGLLSYLALAGILLGILIKKIKQRKDEIYLLTLGLFIIVNIQSIFSNTLDFHPQIAMYWFVIGLAINKSQKEESKTTV